MSVGLGYRKYAPERWGVGVGRGIRDTLDRMTTVRHLPDLFSRVTAHWQPAIVATLNGQHVKVVKFQGEFIWHHHADEDEMFLVHKGSFRMEYRDRTETLQAGDFVVVPRGVEHRPVADEEVEVVLFEPASTRNTGNEVSERTVTPGSLT
jgi:mannose-6-phosphate isomerase-like protein (cupin superfamily)